MKIVEKEIDDIRSRDDWWEICIKLQEGNRKEDYEAERPA